MGDHLPPLPDKIALYVGDLDATVNEEDLMGVFSCFGTVLSARVCRNRNSGESLRYAYINFASKSSAEKALEALNHVALKEKPMRIMWTDRNPIGRTSGIGNLFVKNLDKSVDGAELEKLFRPFGRVISCKVELDEKGLNKGFGFVQMDNEEAAMAAIAALHGTVHSSACKKLYIAKFVRKCERKGTPQRPQGFNNLYIKNLEKDISSDILHEKFSEYGKVNSIAVMKDENGNPRGFGFVSFESPEGAKKAMDIMNGAILGSKILYVGPALKKFERENITKKSMDGANSQQPNKMRGTTVYVKNLGDSISDEALQEHFASCGKIVWSKAWRYSNGRCKGYGFVCFSSIEEASKAVVKLNGSKLNGKHIYVAIAQHRENRINSSLYQHSFTSNFPFLSPPACYGLTHGLASVYQPGILGLPIGNQEFQYLPAPLVYSPQEIATYFRQPACYAPSKSPMHPIMVYLPQETSFVEGRYVDDYNLNQRYFHPSMSEKGTKRTQNAQFPPPNASVVKKACSNSVPRDLQAMLSKHDTLDPQLCNSFTLKPKHASSKPKLLAQLVKETAANEQRVEDQVAASRTTQRTET